MTNKGVSVLRVRDQVLASPRALTIGAPIENREATAMIGAAEYSPRADGTFTSPADPRMTIPVVSSFRRTPESSTRKDTAMESAKVSFAKDTEVVLARIHRVDDRRGSGARKLGPGVFLQRSGNL
jgi:hypothetical protein